MHPVELSSPLLRLDQPRPDDAQRVFEYCQDPVMPQYLARLPWPYRLEDATGFITGYVPSAWANDQECTWAVRDSAAPELLGVISLSVPAGDAAARAGSIGFWVGAAHRGRGLMVEAQRLVLDWGFSTGLCDSVHWECVAGNLASARTARKAGFRYTGQGPAGVAYRDGTHPPSWKGALRAADDRTPPAGWPAEVVGA
ncbi:RimJ/RimL family protein N-acetyltransferase [Cryobacterium sp. MP_3.1]|uniref:GNAT family N-acetyltransferase n=1 Tax=unclassified Cryobacterium TaxID=2649013 RepID=UPI000B4D5208|nr:MULTISPECIES: GNAT family N-acetyltransferase [unclassified Cryobacterium]ASD21159.1 GNAT family N-acetyltransferase [Cryobacterium sp. LW097]MEC5183090.1 RimJ/RimL family protein N-acetyltransferase [Cryobacterium sp. MP_3.1]TFC86046.1 N-acetyltransferase [Cryobacterium sp. TMT4-31]